MNKITALFLSSLLLVPAVWAENQDESPVISQGAPAYLGVRIHRIPDMLRAQLPESIADNQGMLVIRVMPNSPAEQAGIQKNDILLSFNGQALKRPDDLINAVRQAGAGAEAKIELLRRGKPMSLQVKLAQHPAYQARPKPARMQVWESFESFSISKDANDQYTVKLEVLDPEGNKKSFSYQGSRDEIRQQIQQEKAIAPAQKERLLNALSDRMPMPMIPDFRELERRFFGPHFKEIEELERRFFGSREEFFNPPPWFYQPYYR